MEYLILASILLAPPTVVWSAAETTAGWSGRPALIDDARFGAHAVRYTLAADSKTEPTFDFGPTGQPPTAEHLATFWYRVSGEGRVSLAFKLICDFTEGWQGTWLIDPTSPADGRWRKAVVDLGTPWLRWGEAPLPDRTLAVFRLQTDSRSAVTVDIDQLQLEPRRFQAAALGSRVVDGQPRARVRLTNLLAEALALEVAGTRVDLPASAQRVVEVPLAELAPTVAALPPLVMHRAEFAVQVAGEPESAVDRYVEFAGAMALPPHPRTTPVVAAEVHARAAADEALGARLRALLTEAAGRLTKPIELPDRGSQWWHWYACEDDGADLRTVSPTEHECPRCGRVYSGYPYDDVVLARIHDEYASAVKTLGLAYLLTDDARFARRAGEILLAYAAVYESYPLHNIDGKAQVGGGKVAPQTLDESTWLVRICQGADLVWPTLSAADRATIADGLLRPAAEVIQQHRLGLANHQCWKNSAVGLVGLILGDAALIADAVHGAGGFEFQIVEGINLDGQWYEGAWGYHFYTMQALVPLAEAGLRCGLGLYEFERDGRSLRMLFEAPLRLAMPNRVLPNFSDSGYVRLVDHHPLYEVGLRRYGDPRYAAVIADGPGDSLEALLLGVRPLP